MTCSETHTRDASLADRDLAERLLANHRAFLDFLHARLGDRQLAEDLLQDAFVRGIERAGQLRQDESAVAWFYRVLRNAVVDHHRRQSARTKRLEALAKELDVFDASSDVGAAVCGCVASLVGTLKPEYANALRRIELEGVSVKEYASEAGITPNNAAVLALRARRALRDRLERTCRTCAKHGCLDCTCADEAPSEEAP